MNIDLTELQASIITVCIMDCIKNLKKDYGEFSIPEKAIKPLTDIILKFETVKVEI